MENHVICAACHRELMPAVPPQQSRRLPYETLTPEGIALILAWLQTFTFTPMQAEHLSVILRAQTRAARL